MYKITLFLNVEGSSATITNINKYIAIIIFKIKLN